MFIRITPTGSGYKNRSPERAAIDLARANADASLVPDLEVTNRFEPDGFRATCDIVAEFIASRIGR
jgi:hypothetical protein